jgi:hypothetical protein
MVGVPQAAIQQNVRTGYRNGSRAAFQVDSVASADEARTKLRRINITREARLERRLSFDTPETTSARCIRFVPSGPFVCDIARHVRGGAALL